MFYTYTKFLRYIVLKPKTLISVMKSKYFNKERVFHLVYLPVGFPN